MFVLVVLTPILYMLLSLLNTDGVGGALNHISLFDRRQIGLAGNSLGTALGATAGCLLIGPPLAYFLLRTNLWGKNVLKVLCLVPMLIPPYVHAIVWNDVSRTLGDWLPLDVHSVWGVIFVLTLAYFPFVMLMALSGLESIDRNMEEASLLHHGEWATLRRVTLPLATPHILSGAVFVFIFAITDFSVPDILRVRVYPVEIFVQFSAFYNEAGAMMLSLPLMAITFLLVLVQRRILKDRSYVNMYGGRSNASHHRLGRWNVCVFMLALVVVGLSVATPIWDLMERAGALSNYIRVLKTSYSQILYSLFVSSIGAAATLFLGLLLAIVIERSRSEKVKSIFLYAAIAPLAVPATTLGIGMIRVWNRPATDFVFESTWVTVFGYVARFLPFAVMAIASNLKQISPRIEEAAALATPHWLRVLWRIVLPLLSPGLTVGFFVVLILSFGEIGTTLLVIPPGRETIPIKIYNLMHYGANSMVAALSLMLIVIILALAGLFSAVYRRLSERVSGR